MRCGRCAGERFTKVGRDRSQRRLYRCSECGRRVTARTGSAFNGHRFPDAVIALAVRWYLRFRLSYAEVAEWLAERGVTVDPSTVYDWVQAFTPRFIDAARRHRSPVGTRWRVDETVGCINPRLSEVASTGVRLVLVDEPSQPIATGHLLDTTYWLARMPTSQRCLQLQRAVRASRIVMGDVLPEDLLQVPWPRRSSQSTQSRRTVPTHRSATAFARGARTGVRTTRMPLARNTASKEAANLASRSWMRMVGPVPLRPGTTSAFGLAG
jgi:transposase-like protein